MSEHIPTLDDNIFINSCADREGFGLAIYHMNRGKIGYVEYSWTEYELLLRKSWEELLEAGKRPELAGYSISDMQLVHETIHYIAPNSFSEPCGARLSAEQESFLYWLKSQSSRIAGRISPREFQYLDGKLDSICATNIGRADRPRRRISS